MLDVVGLHPELLALFLWQSAELVGVHRAVIFDGQGGNAYRGGPECEPRLPRRVLHFVGHGLTLHFDLFNGLFHAVGVVVALERARYLTTACIDKLVHVLHKHPHHAAGQANRHRLGRLLEIVHVAPVRRDRLIDGDTLNVGPERGIPAGAREPRYEQIEAGLVYVQSQLQGADGALLSDSPLQGRELFSGLKTQLVGVALRSEPVRRYSQTFDTHVTSPPRGSSMPPGPLKCSA